MSESDKYFLFYLDSTREDIGKIYNYYRALIVLSIMLTEFT